jgi:hypothetical protein
MAWTGIKVIRDDIERSIDYVQDEKKTALQNNIEYAFNRDKTETSLFESAIGCSSENAYQEMMAVKHRFHKAGGVQGYHLVQSFQTDEVTPEQCHALGLDLARRLLPEGYQVVVCSHLNTDQYHNHLVWNSVNSITGKKYHIGEKDLYLTIRRISDEICHEHGLSVIDPKPGSRGEKYYPYMLKRNGKPQYRDTVKEIIDRAINDMPDILTRSQLLDYFREQGYGVNENPRRMYVTVLPPGTDRVIRLGPKLGTGYSMEDILERLAAKPVPRRITHALLHLDEDVPEGYTRSPRKNSAVKYRRSIFQPTSLRAAFSLRGLRAMYFDYLRRMGVRPGNRRWEPEETLALKGDLAKLNQRVRQMNYLSRTGYETATQLHARVAELQEQIQPLLAERKKLYRKPGNEAAIAAINEQLRPVWAEIYLCRDIERHSEDIRKKLRDVREAQRGTQRDIRDKEHSGQERK